MVWKLLLNMLNWKDIDLHVYLYSKYKNGVIEGGALIKIEGILNLRGKFLGCNNS